MRSVGGDHAVATTTPAGSRGAIVLAVPPLPGAIGTARRAVVDHLIAHGVASTVVDDLELVTSELVTNAIVHPRPAVADADVDVDVRVDVSDEICLTVANVGSVASIPPIDAWLPATPGALSGRGLGIVRRLCDVVVVEQRGDRAVVVCRRHLPDGGAMP